MIVVLVLEDILSLFITLLFYLNSLSLLQKKVRVLFINVCASHFLCFVNIFSLFVLFVTLPFHLKFASFITKTCFCNWTKPHSSHDLSINTTYIIQEVLSLPHECHAPVFFHFFHSSQRGPQSKSINTN